MANERLINSVSVGIVFVDAEGYEISNEEKVRVQAGIIDGLGQLANGEPDANISWVYSTLSVTLPSFTPWVGANWPGLPDDYYDGGIDAALWSATNQKIYFFKGNEYVRIDPNNSWQMDAGYPKPIVGNWPGLDPNFTNGIDAALWSATNQKIYFFKGSEYVRIDPNNGWQMDAGYPKPIVGNWPGLASDFTEGIDAALWSDTNQKIYFFKKHWLFAKYVRIVPANSWQMDTGYPKPIGLGWAAEDLWRDPALTELGFSTGGNGVIELVEFLQGAANAQYGYVGFFTKLPTAHIGYASSGIRRVTMYRAGSFLSWSIPSIGSIFAHETGHIFHAPDEYSGSNCNCGGSHGAFFTTVNGNCALCATSPVNCLMKNNTINSICEFTRLAIGWTAFLARIDGGLYSFANDKLYMFSGGYYIRYTGFTLDPDYPKTIEGNWPGFPADFVDGVDAALWSNTNNKIYFFKGSEYIRVDPASDWNVDPGYPRPIAGNWPGFPADFADGVDAALWGNTNSKIYFFKGTEYIRVDPANSWNVDPGYPRWINNNWRIPFPTS